MKQYSLVAVLSLVLALMLPGCTAGQGGMTASDAAGAVSSAVLSQPDGEVSSASVSSTPPNAPDGLAMYSDIEDIPFARYSFTVLDTEYDRPGEIMRDGQVILGPPGESQFENPVFMDEQYLYVRAVWPDGEYQWYYFDVSLPEAQADIVVPDSQNKMFVGTWQRHLLCEDGTGFDTEKWEWN